MVKSSETSASSAFSSVIVYYQILFWLIISLICFVIFFLCSLDSSWVRPYLDFYHSQFPILFELGNFCDVFFQFTYFCFSLSRFILTSEISWVCFSIVTLFIFPLFKSFFICATENLIVSHGCIIIFSQLFQPFLLFTWVILIMCFVFFELYNFFIETGNFFILVSNGILIFLL